MTTLDIMNEITNEGGGEGEGCLMAAIWPTTGALVLVNIVVWSVVLWVL